MVPSEIYIHAVMHFQREQLFSKVRIGIYLNVCLRHKYNHKRKHNWFGEPAETMVPQRKPYYKLALRDYLPPVSKQKRLHPHITLKTLSSISEI